MHCAWPPTRPGPLPNSTRAGGCWRRMTIVEQGGEALGKPVDRAEADAMLRRLRGGVHRVTTAMALQRTGADSVARTSAVSTEVHMRAFSDAELSAYLDGGEWQGKAGAYAVQGMAAAFVAEVRGSISNVIGLPLSEVVVLLGALGIAQPRYPADQARQGSVFGKAGARKLDLRGTWANVQCMRVLGVDPGSRLCGYAVVDVNDRRTCTHVECGVLSPELSGSAETRLGNMPAGSPTSSTSCAPRSWPSRTCSAARSWSALALAQARFGVGGRRVVGAGRALVRAHPHQAKHYGQRQRAQAAGRQDGKHVAGIADTAPGRCR